MVRSTLAAFAALTVLFSVVAPVPADASHGRWSRSRASATVDWTCDDGIVVETTLSPVRRVWAKVDGRWMTAHRPARWVREHEVTIDPDRFAGEITAVGVQLWWGRTRWMPVSAPTCAVETSELSTNQPPTANADHYDVDEDTTLSVSAPGVLGNDSDADGDTPTATLVAGPGNGTLNLTSDGAFDYTPNTDFNGTDSFTYGVWDGTDTTEATVTLTVNPVNDAPVGADDTLMTDEDTALTFDVTTLLANDLDIDGDSLTGTVTGRPNMGNLTDDGDGTFTYAPDRDFAGTDGFTYEVTDGEYTATATVTVVVNPVNDAPVAPDVTLETYVDTPIDLTLEGTDVDRDPLDVVVNDPLVRFNPTDSTYRFTPPAGATGEFTFEYSVSDGVATTTGTVTVTVTEPPETVNTPPTAEDFTVSTVEGTPVTIDVTAHASDADGDALSYSVSSVEGIPANVGISNGVITVEPFPYFTGVVTIVYLVVDPDGTSATGTITVDVVAPPPEL